MQPLPWRLLSKKLNESACTADGLPITTGARGGALTMARQNNKWQHNDATLTECEPLLVNTAALRDFLLPTTTTSFGVLRNGSSTDSCMWLTDDSSETQPHQDRGRIISMAPCGQPGSAWKYTASSGQIASTDVAGLCVGYWVSRHG